MLWLAGLMGLMAVGAVTFVDPQFGSGDEDEATDDAPPPLPASIGDTASDVFFGDEDFSFDAPASDPRGGDDAADLPPLFQDPAQMVNLQFGDAADDALAGADGQDRIFAGAGMDRVAGGAGDDELHGGDHADTLVGEMGRDTLHGDDGDDRLHGGDHDDLLFGHDDDDSLWGEDGDDVLHGSAGDDLLNGGAGDDALHGGPGSDTLTGEAGSDTLFGGWGNDWLSGVMQASGPAQADGDTGDFLNGGGGADTLIAGAGDTISAGSGADDIVLGDWITGGDGAQITDYDAEEDSLLMVWDDTADDAAEPRIEVTADPDAEDRSLVLMDGAVVATVFGTTLRAEDVSLVPLSEAQFLGL